MHLLLYVLGVPLLYQDGVTLLLVEDGVMQVDAVPLVLRDVDTVMLDCFHWHIPDTLAAAHCYEQHTAQEHQQHPQQDAHTAFFFRF